MLKIWNKLKQIIFAAKLVVQIKSLYLIWLMIWLVPRRSCLCITYPKWGQVETSVAFVNIFAQKFSNFVKTFHLPYLWNVAHQVNFPYIFWMCFLWLYQSIIRGVSAKAVHSWSNSNHIALALYKWYCSITHSSCVSGEFPKTCKAAVICPS